MSRDYKAIIPSLADLSNQGLASAVNYLHSNQIRHRDIKPENILVKGSNIYLTDFGISLDWENLSRSTTVAESGKTPLYCAPEVANHQKRNSSSDIWSLGCVFLEMCTVLKGRRLEEMRQVFKQSSDTYTFCRNLPAIANWALTLRNFGSEFDNHPIEWSISMLQFDPDSRPNALNLHKIISTCKLNSGHEKITFCMDCCFPDDEDDSTVGSISDGDLWAEDFDDEVTSPPLTHDATDPTGSKSSVQTASLFDNDGSEHRSPTTALLSSLPTGQHDSVSRGQQNDEQNKSIFKENIADSYTASQPSSQLLAQSFSKVNLQNPAPQANHSVGLPRILWENRHSPPSSSTPNVSDVIQSRNVDMQAIRPNYQHPTVPPKQDTTEQSMHDTVFELPPDYEDIDRLEKPYGGADTNKLGPNLERFESRSTGKDTMFNASDTKEPYRKYRNINLPQLSPEDWMTPLSFMKAVEDNDEVMDYLLSRYSELSAIPKSSSRYTIRVVQLLIENGIDINSKLYEDKDGITPILQVLMWSNEDEFESLFLFMMHMGADMTVMASEGRSVFTRAARLGNIWAVAALVRYKGPKPTQWRSHLVTGAMLSDQLEVLQCLIDLGIFECHGKDHDGEPWINVACIIGAADAVRFILNSSTVKVDVEYHYKDASPLYNACKWGRLEVVQLLMSLDAPRLPKRFKGLELFLIATYNGHHTVMEHLLKVIGDQIDINAGLGSLEPALCQACSRGYIEATRLLLAHGANTSILDRVCLQNAARNGKTEIVKLLLDHGAATAPYPGHLAPLYLACCEGHIEIAGLLLAHGAYPNEDNGTTAGKWTCLHQAAKNGSTEIVKLLLDHGAVVAPRALPVFSGKVSRKTPLNLAEEGGHTEVVELLVMAKAQEQIRKSNKRK